MTAATGWGNNPHGGTIAKKSGGRKVPSAGPVEPLVNARYPLFLLGLLAPGFASAQPTSRYADPPDGRPVAVVASPTDAPEPPPASPSPVRLHVGTAGRTGADSVRAGLLAALDIGRGPTGVRLSGTWVRVGYDDPLAQYTGELTLSLLEHPRWIPSLGVGGGLARTYRVDPSGQRTSGGASLGVGVLRASLEYRLPLHATDARLGLNAAGSLPAIKEQRAPDLPPWLLLSATVGVGF